MKDTRISEIAMREASGAVSQVPVQKPQPRAEKNIYVLVGKFVPTYLNLHRH